MGGPRLAEARPTLQALRDQTMMRTLLISLGLVVVLDLAGSSSTRAADDFRPLFNGKDLAGWVPINVAPETFTVRDGMIVSTGKPKGMLRTERPYENFIFEVEWRVPPPAGQAPGFLLGDPPAPLRRAPAPGVE